ncbi:hypothetical protein [Streptomyces sp. NPDC049555]|uniref:hypothetical protein n=1 Tax=unclassified Streptomyces TaxID=2593676 RepID=UPI00342882FE
MQSNDARTLLQCAVPTALTGVVAVVVGFVVAGAKGGIGATTGVALTGAVMASGLVILQRTAKHLPHLFQAMGLLLYMTQMLLVAVFLMVFKDTTLFDTKVFAFTLLAATLVWIAAQARAYMKAKILYVETSRETEKTTPAGSPS